MAEVGSRSTWDERRPPVVAGAFADWAALGSIFEHQLQQISEQEQRNRVE
jgi:hypothetical protein